MLLLPPPLLLIASPSAHALNHPHFRFCSVVTTISLGTVSNAFSRSTKVVIWIVIRVPKCTMLEDRDYDVTPYIIAHLYPQMHQGSAKSARCTVEMVVDNHKVTVNITRCRSR